MPLSSTEVSNKFFGDEYNQDGKGWTLVYNIIAGGGGKVAQSLTNNSTDMQTFSGTKLGTTGFTIVTEGDYLYLKYNDNDQDYYYAVAVKNLIALYNATCLFDNDAYQTAVQNTTFTLVSKEKLKNPGANLGNQISENHANRGRLQFQHILPVVARNNVLPSGVDTNDLEEVDLYARLAKQAIDDFGISNQDIATMSKEFLYEMFFPQEVQQHEDSSDMDVALQLSLDDQVSNLNASVLPVQDALNNPFVEVQPNIIISSKDKAFYDYLRGQAANFLSEAEINTLTIRDLADFVDSEISLRAFLQLRAASYLGHNNVDRLKNTTNQRLVEILSDEIVYDDTFQMLVGKVAQNLGLDSRQEGLLEMLGLSTQPAVRYQLENFSDNVESCLFKPQASCAQQMNRPAHIIGNNNMVLVK